jgi:glycosyltransferase involved in cell wall biosynthesis
MIGIALLTLVPGKLGGSESATAGLLRTLAERGTLPYCVYLPRVAENASEGLPHAIVPEYLRAETIPGRLLAMLTASARPGPLRRRLAGADVVHYPLTIRIPPVSSPSVVTLNDLQHLDLPQLFSRGERLFRHVFWHRSVRGAQLVVTPTAFARDRATALLGINEHRLRVIPYGIDHVRFAPTGEAREQFLLYPARRWPHKNHAKLFEAFALLRRERPELRLVLTGGGHEDEAPEGVDVRGHISLDELVSLYRRAGAVVFPSLYEGFGQPVLEAMACGCPVACSAIPPLEEIAGDAARTFDPTSAEAIAAAVAEVLASPDGWSARGLARAAQYTWERTATEYESVYRELLR